MNTPTLSLTMRNAIAAMERGDRTITRCSGGFWRTDPTAAHWYDVQTIRALVKRGVVEFCEYKRSAAYKNHPDPEAGRFPTKARLTLAPPTSPITASHQNDSP